MIEKLTSIIMLLRGLDVGFNGLTEPPGNAGAWLVVAPSGQADRFYNLSREEPLQFQILVKHPTPNGAIVNIDAIKDTLERFGIEAYTQPSQVERDEKRALYTALFRTIIEKEGN